MGPGIAEVHAEAMRKTLTEDGGDAVVCREAVVLDLTNATEELIGTLRVYIARSRLT
jgi:hypothetical protein